MVDYSVYADRRPCVLSAATPAAASVFATLTQGVQVGEFWRDRLHCRQWGAHFPHVAGIAGQSGRGAQSVVLSGGCVLGDRHQAQVSTIG